MNNRPDWWPKNPIIHTHSIADSYFQLGWEEADKAIWEAIKKCGINVDSRLFEGLKEDTTE